MAGEVEGYSSSIHDSSVSAGFRALYEEGLLVDVTLVIEDHQFQAHKALLATQSDYFRIMFTADMRERDQDKIYLKGLTATGFSHVLQFMYYGSIDLSMATVHEILQAAMYVQLTEVVKFCCSFLMAKICLENCAEIMRLLDDFSVDVEGVREKLDSFLLENFVPLMSRPEFLSYLSFEKLKSYLDSDRLSRFPEIELYEAVQAWLRHDRRRWRHTDSIIQNIRFCLMTPSSVYEKVLGLAAVPVSLSFVSLHVHASSEKRTPKEVIKVEELSLYSSPVHESKYIEKSQTQLEDGISWLRHSVSPYTDWCQDAYTKLKPKVETAVDHSIVTYEFLKDAPPGFYPRLGLIGFAGLVGLFLARGSKVKKAVYPIAFMGLGASLYYPQQAATIAKDTGTMLYDQSLKAYVNLESLWKDSGKKKKSGKKDSGKSEEASDAPLNSITSAEGKTQQ
uniref:MICOS complex subunit n=1 Tax=Leptobrachium leishanense TaxID=445787 RepID=A0A8C5WLH2_9ANUR